MACVELADCDSWDLPSDVVELYDAVRTKVVADHWPEHKVVHLFQAFDIVSLIDKVKRLARLVVVVVNGSLRLERNRRAPHRHRNADHLVAWQD